jgi:hypothetical protein
MKHAMALFDDSHHGPNLQATNKVKEGTNTELPFSGVSPAGKNVNATTETQTLADNYHE